MILFEVYCYTKCIVIRKALHGSLLKGNLTRSEFFWYLFILLSNKVFYLVQIFVSSCISLCQFVLLYQKPSIDGIFKETNLSHSFFIHPFYFVLFDKSSIPYANICLRQFVLLYLKLYMNRYCKEVNSARGLRIRPFNWIARIFFVMFL